MATVAETSDATIERPQADAAPEEKRAPDKSSEEEPLERSLGSGRTLVMQTTDGGERIEVLSADGDVEVRIVLADDGPQVTVRGGRLKLDSPDSIEMRCRKFDVETTERTRFYSDGQVLIASQEARVRTADDIWLNGALVRIQSP